MPATPATAARRISRVTNFRMDSLALALFPGRFFRILKSDGLAFSEAPQHDQIVEIALAGLYRAALVTISALHIDAGFPVQFEAV